MVKFNKKRRCFFIEFDTYIGIVYKNNNNYVLRNYKLKEEVKYGIWNKVKYFKLNKK